ncbi:hypothetical protein [Arthrobacter sp. OY3WO11]|uniref:hypothetical protein n=1 Tax=Arthrobacter sp. OY3WO11 TaxID=1835723 RepID=UPI000B2551AD|nr:hypothetical protein [Arthrobacter sp. OY3WO11]
MSESTTEMTGVMIDPVTGDIIDQKKLAERLLAQAKEQGVSLVGGRAAEPALRPERSGCVWQPGAKGLSR